MFFSCLLSFGFLQAASLKLMNRLSLSWATTFLLQVLFLAFYSCFTLLFQHHLIDPSCALSWRSTKALLVLSCWISWMELSKQKPHARDRRDECRHRMLARSRSFQRLLEQRNGKTRIWCIIQTANRREGRRYTWLQINISLMSKKVVRRFGNETSSWWQRIELK